MFLLDFYHNLRSKKLNSQYLYYVCFFRKVLGQNHAPLAQEYAKKGVPLSYRAKIWTQILNVSVDDIVSAFF